MHSETDPTTSEPDKAAAAEPGMQDWYQGHLMGKGCGCGMDERTLRQDVPIQG